MDPVGGMDLRCGHFSVKMYAKTKELGPIGWRAPEIFVCRSATKNIEERLFDFFPNRKNSLLVDMLC